MVSNRKKRGKIGQCFNTIKNIKFTVDFKYLNLEGKKVIVSWYCNPTKKNKNKSSI